MHLNSKSLISYSNIVSQFINYFQKCAPYDYDLCDSSSHSILAGRQIDFLEQVITSDVKNFATRIKKVPTLIMSNEFYFGYDYHRSKHCGFSSKSQPTNLFGWSSQKFVSHRRTSSVEVNLEENFRFVKKKKSTRSSLNLWQIFSSTKIGSRRMLKILSFSQLQLTMRKHQNYLLRFLNICNLFLQKCREAMKRVENKLNILHKIYYIN